MTKTWICAQLGSRENYAIPRALNHLNSLAMLYTDIWLPPGNVISGIVGKNLGRYHPGIEKTRVKGFNLDFISRKFFTGITRRTLNDDEAFDKTIANSLRHRYVKADVFFNYSYSSLESMKAARDLGLRTVLGQINPGPGEAAIVESAFLQFEHGRHRPSVPPPAYWDRWRGEVEASDILLVNSTWSQSLLIKEGVPGRKIVVVPLAYEDNSVHPVRIFKKSFDRAAPLRLLYLGGIGIRKGFHHLKEAMRFIRHLPVHLDVVGGLKGPKELLENLPENVTFHGRISKGETGRFYEQADVFVFPTLSDGFGLTQLEAQARKLPLITTPFCADVITHMRNGLIIKSASPDSIVEAITMLVDRPDLIAEFSSNAVSMENFSIASLANRLKAF